MYNIYRYNERRKTLHIFGLCSDSRGIDYLMFSSEMRARTELGDDIHLCEKCAKKRDFELEKVVDKILEEKKKGVKR